METFYSDEELKHLGLKRYGHNVLLSRNALLYRPDELEIGSHVRIDDFTTIGGKVSLGDYIHIAQFCGLYGGRAGITMADFCTVSSRVAIYAASNDYSGQFMVNPMVADQYSPDIEAPVFLDKHVIVGCASVILPGVSIGKGCAVGAMSLVRTNLNPWGIYVGIPTKYLKARSKALLKLEEKFMQEQRLTAN